LRLFLPLLDANIMQVIAAERWRRHGIIVGGAMLAVVIFNIGGGTPVCCGTPVLAPGWFQDSLSAARDSPRRFSPDR